MGCWCLMYHYWLQFGSIQLAHRLNWHKRKTKVWKFRVFSCFSIVFEWLVVPWEWDSNEIASCVTVWLQIENNRMIIVNIGDDITIYFTWCFILLTWGFASDTWRLNLWKTFVDHHTICMVPILPRGLNHRPTSCVTTPRNTQCIASVVTLLTMLQKSIHVLRCFMPNPIASNYTFYWTGFNTNK